MEIDCPTIWTGDSESPSTGLAYNTFWDAELSAQTGVYYARPHNHGYLQDFFKWNGQSAVIVERASNGGALRNDNDTGFGNNPPFRYSSDLREWAVRGRFITTDSGSSDYKWFFDQTLTHLGPYPNNASDPTDAYVRTYMKLESDFLTTVDHMKGVVGFTSINGPTSNFGPGGERADGTNGWRAHQHIGRKSPISSNPYVNLHFAGGYIYHMDQEGNFGDTVATGVDDVGFGTTSTRWGCGTSAGNRGGDGFPGFCYERDRWYCVEMRVKMNSVSPTVADGILEVWINGVKVYSKTNFRWRTTADLKIQSVYCNMYHGGTTPPNVEMHYQMTNFVVASSYIGPMRMEAVPSWVATTAGQLKTIPVSNSFSSANPSVFPDATYQPYGNSNHSNMEDFSGGVFHPWLGRWGSLIFHGGGHASYWGNQVVKLDMETRLYAMAHSSSVLPSRNTSGNNVMTPGADPDPVFDNTECEYGDGRPGSAHTYDALEIVPPWAGGGTKGTLVRPTSGAVHPFNSRSTGRAHRFPFALEDWSRWSSNALSTNTTPGAACAFDPRRNRVWWLANGFNGQTFIRYFDIRTGVQTQVNITSAISIAEPDSPLMRYDAERDILIFTLANTTTLTIRYLSGLSNATLTGWTAPTLSQTITARQGWQHPLDYVPDVDRWFLLSPSSSLQDGVYEIQVPSNPANTWTVTRRQFSGITSIPVKYTAGKRWSYSPKLKNFVWHGDILQSQGPYAYRPHGVT
jgi:hypothetical protein